MKREKKDIRNWGLLSVIIRISGILLKSLERLKEGLGQKIFYRGINNQKI